MEDLEANAPNPSCSTPLDDCRINCTNSEHLRNILDITMKNVSELANASNLKDQRSEFIKQFSDVYRNVLQENIVVNGFPWVVDKNKLTSPEKEDHKHMVDDAVLNQLSTTVASVAHKRKICPQQCCRMLNLKIKHEIQNLKKTKVIDSSPPLSLSPETISIRDKRHISRFSKFCKNFSSVQETALQQVTEREKINVASTIQTRQYKRNFVSI